MPRSFTAVYHVSVEGHGDMRRHAAGTCCQARLVALEQICAFVVVRADTSKILCLMSDWRQNQEMYSTPYSRCTISRSRCHIAFTPLVCQTPNQTARINHLLFHLVALGRQ